MAPNHRESTGGGTPASMSEPRSFDCPCRRCTSNDPFVYVPRIRRDEIRSTEATGPREDPRHVIAYVRVSTDEQRTSGGGIAAQRAAITAECEHRGWRI